MGVCFNDRVIDTFIESQASIPDNNFCKKCRGAVKVSKSRFSGRLFRQNPYGAYRNHRFSKLTILDEFPEFHRDVVNALREPLEDKVVSISRAKGSSVFPANFMLIAALNPCPCGFWGTKRCECMPHLVEKYRRKISGPVADRIDMWVSVGDIAPEAMAMRRKKPTGESEATRKRIEAAREQQKKRFKDTKHVSTNADMKPKQIETLAQLTPKAEAALIGAARSLKLSPRGYHRTIKLARTIADLAGSETIEPNHMLEALQYRAREA